MNSIVIDTRSRDLIICAASVTAVPSVAEQGGGIVLRKGVDIGKLSEGFVLDPNTVLILMGNGYQAVESAGFVSWFEPSQQVEVCCSEKNIVGLCGFGRTVYGKGFVGDALRPLKKPIPAKIIWPNEGRMLQIEQIRTHTNSNIETAAAACAGLKILANYQRNFVLCEGQSDYVRAWLLGEIPFPPPVFEEDAPPYVEPNIKSRTIPDEHRLDIFIPSIPA